MGKHKRRTPQKEPTPEPLKKISNQLRSKVNPLVQKLISKCTSNVNPKKELEEYREIYNLVQDVRQLENDYVVPFPHRKDHWPDFFEWCSKNGAEFSSVTAKEIEEGNFGLFAEKDLKKNDTFLTVPRKLMMCLDDARRSKLGPLLTEDPMLSAMPNVSLAIYLITEYLNKESFWKPYLSILPEHYNTVLYFSIEELELLQRSPVLSQAISLCRSVARQYAYFNQLFQNNMYALTLDIAQHFTYDLYRWAVSTVMTRQNAFPLLVDDATTVLVPLWDLCNHQNGMFSTDFNEETNSIQSYAMQDFNKDEEVKIFYGPRTNSEFFLHNAFLYPESESDTFPLQLNISKSDRFFLAKTNFCLKRGIPLNGKFYLKINGEIENELLVFLRINILKEDEVMDILKDENNLEEYIETKAEIQNRAVSFLSDRLALLLKCYKTTLEEDEILFESEQSHRSRMSIQLRMCEKKILKTYLNYCLEQK